MDTKDLKVGDYVMVVNGEYGFGKPVAGKIVGDSLMETYGVLRVKPFASAVQAKYPDRDIGVSPKNLKKITEEEAQIWILSN